MLFSRLIGNDRVKTYLTTLLRQKTVPSVLLFRGPEGVGKSLFAKEFSLALMQSPHPKEDLADLHVLRTEGKSQMHTIESIRELIEEMSLPPYESFAKVFIIHDAERMLPASANALLKTLEDPPPGSYLILLSHDAERMLPTVLSRCRQIAFHPVSEIELSQWACTAHHQTQEEARRIAFFAQGSFAKACAFLSGDTAKRRALLHDLLTQASKKKSIHAHLETLEETLETASEEDAGGMAQRQSVVLEEILYWYRDLHLLNSGGDVSLLFYADHRRQLEELVRQRVQLPPLDRLLKQLTECRLGLERSMKVRTVLDVFFLKIADSF